MPVLFLLFIVIPLIEITLLINVGQAIGAWYTIGLVLLSAFVGVNMLRRQGLSTLLRARERMDSGQIPAQEMIEGLILAVGGALLITPGFVTDFFGFCCLVPATRRALVGRLRRHFTVVTPGYVDDPSDSQTFRPHSGAERPPHQKSSGTTIEGEYRRED